MKFFNRQGLGFCIAVAALAAVAQTGTTIKISSFDDIRKIGTSSDYPAGGNYELTSDIDASSSRSRTFSPVSFSGTFDGKDHSINGLYIKRNTGNGNTGLFEIAQNAAIRNVVLAVDSIIGVLNVGALAGVATNTTIENCHVKSGYVGGQSSVGGLVGFVSGTTIKNSSSRGTCYAAGYKGSAWESGAVGGLVGQAEDRSVISDSYASGNVTSALNNAGGLLGYCGGVRIIRCYSTGNVKGDSFVGGLIGFADENSGNNLSKDNNIINCYSTGSVTGSSEIGGLTGGNGGTITDSYATGSVKGSSRNSIGGLVGHNFPKGIITKCYAVGVVSGGSGTSSDVGGLAGYNRGGGTITGSYWDTGTSGLTASGGGMGRTTAQMKMKSTFVNWDFDTVWMINEGIDYPSLFGFGKYCLRYRAGPGGSIAIGDTVQVVESGSRGSTVVAIPDDGYEFANWSDGLANSIRTDSNVTSNKILKANFCSAANIKSLTYKAVAGGAISGPASQKVCGASSGLPVTAVPNDGYKFVEWSDGKKDAVRTDAGGAANAEFTANFAIKSYTLVYTAGPNGSLVGGDAVMTVNHGSDGGLVLALANDGYEFVKWSDGVTSNPRTDKNVSANIAASAVFDTLRHNLSYYVSPTHGVLAGSAAQRVAHGANGSAVYVTGINGYKFFEWSDGSKDSIRTDKNILADIAVAAIFKDAAGNVSVNSFDRVIPPVNLNSSKESSVIAPIAVLTAEFTVGPNPVGSLRATPVQFFHQGSHISSATLRIYDASGNAVCKVAIKDNATVDNGVKRPVGSWDLRDAKGRPVSGGAYLLRGVVKTADGKVERVSLVVGVR